MSDPAAFVVTSILVPDVMDTGTATIALGSDSGTTSRLDGPAWDTVGGE